MNTSDRISGESAGRCAGSTRSSRVRLIDRNRMRVLDRKCTKAQNAFKMWEKYDLDPGKWPGCLVVRAKADFAKADAKRKELRHKIKAACKP